MQVRFKALFDSGAALSLVHTSFYSMTEDCYKTKIVPSAVHLKTADRSVMSALSKATLHLHIANFMFSHTFVICDKLLDTDILFGTDIQKRYSRSSRWDADKQLFIQRDNSFLTYVTNTIMYLPQVYWGVNQALIWSQLTVSWV